MRERQPDLAVVMITAFGTVENAVRAMKSGDIGAYLEQHEVSYVLFLHNFQAEYAQQWARYVAPRVETVPPTDWIFRLKRPL